MNELWLKAAGRAYRLLLGTCPRELRHEDGAAELFDSMLGREVERAGWRGFTWFCLGAYSDALVTAGLRWSRVIGSGWSLRDDGDHRTLRTNHGEGDMGMWIGSVSSDVRMGLRTLGRTPAATVIAVGTVAVAIALTTLTLSTVYGAILRPLPFEEASRIVAISWIGADFEAGDLQYFRQRQTAFEGVEGYFQGRATVSGMGDYPESVQTGFVTASALTLLGVRPALGQLFPTGEGVTQPVQHVVLGFDLWRSRYNGRTDILGRRLQIDGYDLEIIGVMPEGFGFPVTEAMWVPIDVAFGGGPGRGRSFSVFGRLHQDRTREYAEVEAEGIAALIRSDGPQENPPQGATVTRFARRHLPAGIDRLLYVMLAAVVGVLLVACSNLSNLLLARSTVRRREVAIRGALGAGRARIAQQFIVEALLLSAAGTALGLGLALFGMEGVTDAVTNVRLPYWVEFRVDAPILVSSILLMISVALAAGTLPALRAGRASARPLLDRGGGGSHGRIGRVGSGLVTAQIAVSLTLLIGAGLLIKSVSRLRSLDHGFESEQVLTAQINLPFTISDPSLFFLTLMEELEALPSVEQAAVARSAPGTGGTFAWDVWVEGEDYGSGAGVPSADGKNIGLGYFDAMGLDLVEGRDFTPDETLFAQGRDGPYVVIVNRTFAQRHLGSTRIGRRVQFGTHNPDAPWFTVVGVVQDGYLGSRSGGIGLSSGAEEQMYIPWGLVPYRSGALLLRTRGEPEASVPEVRALLGELAPGVPLVEPIQLSKRIEETTWAFGLFGKVFTAFGVVALLMSVVGLYGVIAFDVRQRRREMGIRVALGADPSGILRLSMRDGAVQLAVGLVIGSSLALLLAGALQAVIFDVSTRDAHVYAWAIGVVSLAGLSASLIPALTASRLDPQTALRLD